MEVGVTLNHPHGQIYAYPFVPPIPARELERQRAFHAEHGRGLLASVLASERADGRRILFDVGDAVAFMPAFARYAYEIRMMPAAPLPSLADMDGASARAMARVMKAVFKRSTGSGTGPSPM